MWLMGVGLSFTSIKFHICKLKEWLPYMDVKKQNAISDLVFTPPQVSKFWRQPWYLGHHHRHH